MAKIIIWSANAQLDRKDILTYWNNRNKSNVYSIKLNLLFIETSLLLVIHPLTGRKTSIENVRVKIVRDYMMVYKSTASELQILAIFDTRQNPDKLDEIIKK
jgi:toxin YoeB